MLTLARAPLAFEPNRGQDKSAARFVARGAGYLLRLEGDKATMRFRDPVMRSNGRGAADSIQAQTPPRTLTMVLTGGKLRPEMTGESPLPESASYFSGSDPAGWITDVPTYARVNYKAVYPGIDLSFYGKESRLEYDFLLRAGADAGRIGFALEGADGARIDGSGNLLLSVGGREVRFLKPVAYQAGKHGSISHTVDVNYRLMRGKSGGVERLEFSVGPYDHTANLVIDPVLDYGTYLPQSDSFVTGIAVDPSGNTYLSTEGDANGTYFGFSVLKFDPNGNLLSSAAVDTSAPAGIAVPTAIAVSSKGAVYVTGYAAPGLPTTANAYQTANTNGYSYSYFNAFVAVFQPSASSLVPSYISYLGGSGTSSDVAYSIAVDSSGDAYIAGLTGGEPFPTTPGAYQTAYPSNASSAGFLAKFDPTKSGAASLVYSTLLGGTRDYLYGVAADASGDAYVTGTASPGDIAPTSGAFAYSGFNGGNSINVTKLNATGTAVVYSAFLGPGVGNAIALDGSGDAYVTGNTTAEDFPTSSGAYQTKYPGAFVTELNAAGTALVYSTFLGGPSDATYYSYNYSQNVPLRLALTPGCASACAAYIAGTTSATDLPVLNAVQGYQGANPTGFLVELAGNGASAVYSTYLGGVTSTTSRNYLYGLGSVGFTPGVGVDSAGNAYVTGNLSGALDFPVTPTPAEPSGTLENVYLAKIGAGASGYVVAAPATVAFATGIVNVSSAVYPGRTPVTVTLLNTGSKAVTLSPIVVFPATEFAETDNCNGAIAAASSCTLTLTFTPESAGTRTGTITVTSSASATPVTIALSGTGSAQSFIQFTPSTLSFPDQVAGTAGAAQTVTVKNIGHTPATNLSFYYSSGNTSIFPELNNCPSQLDPGDSCQISVQFSPTATGLSTDSIYYGSSALALSGTGIVSGAGGSGASAVSPSAINLGSLLVGNSTSAPVYFTNLSSIAPVTFNSATVALSGSAGSVNDFSIGPCTTLPYQVAASGTCASTVYFTPSVAGTETATITFTDSTASSPHTVTVSGTGVGATQVLEFSPANQVFLPQPLGYQSASQSFTVTDAGTAPVTIDRALVAGDFQILSDGCSGRTLQPSAIPGVNTGGQCSVSVAFTPTALGSRTGTLSLIDAATGSPQVLNLMGTGIAVTGSLIVEPVSLSFPVMPVGLTSATQQVTFQNPGNTPITINSATATGDFAESNYNCPAFPFTLTPNGGTCSISVSFTPTSSTANPRTGTLTVASTAGNQTVSLTGTGEVATQAIGFTPATTANFGPIPVGATSYIYYVVVRNTGTEAVSFSAAAAVSAPYSISSDGCTGGGGTLAAASSCVIALQLTPSATGAQTGTLTLTDTAGTGTQTLSLTGTSIPSTTALSVNAAADNFLQFPVGTSSPIYYTYLYNFGSTQAVNIASVSITAGGNNFSIPSGYDGCTGGTISPGGQCALYIQFAPTVSGYDTGTITFVDTAGNKYAAPLAGYSPADTSSASLFPASAGFSDQVVGTSSYFYNSSNVITLNNTGNQPFTVGTVTGTNYSATGAAGIDFSLDYYGDRCSGATVSPGSSCTIYPSFTPTAAGNRTGTLVIPVTYAGATAPVNFTATLTGVGIADASSAVLSPASSVFADQVVGTSSYFYNSSNVITLNNTGNQPFTVGTVTGTNYSATGAAGIDFSLDYYGDRCSGATVAGGSSCTIYLSFTPTAAGNRTGTLVIPVTYAGATKAVNFTANLSGNGITDANSAVLSPASTVFTNQVVGTTSYVYNTGNAITLQNAGNLPLTVGTVTGTNYSATGAAGIDFSLDYYGDRCSGATLSPGSACTIYPSFTPVAAGNRTGTLVIPVTYSGATKAVNFTATLSGVGVTDATSAVLSPTSTVFADQVVGTTSYIYNTANAIALKNTGNLPLTVGTVTGTNYSAAATSGVDFSLDGYGDGCSTQTLSPGASCTVYPSFTPVAAGNRTGTLVFPITYSGATSAVNLTAALSGRGIPTTATLVLSQTSVAFGSQAVGTTSGQAQVTLTNYSSSALPITSIVLGGTNASDFTESDSCPEGGTLGANSSCQIYLTFKPAPNSLGTRTATITETDPGSGGSRTIALTGTGTADLATLTFYPSPLAFTTSETVNQGAPGKVVTLNYTGSVPLNITTVTSNDPSEFPVVQDGCTGTTAAIGGTCQVIVAFAPAKSGALSAVISVADSASGSPQTFMVTGGAIAGAASTTTVSASPTSAAFGSLFTLVATVKSGTTPVANGSVTFYDGTAAIGTAQVVTTTSGGGTVGTATLKTLYLPLGANSITAKYTGANASSTSAATTVTVTGKYPDSATLTSTGTQSSYILTGTVTGGGPQTPLPTGKITFTDNQTSTTLGTVALDPTTLTQSFVNASTPATGSNYPTTVTLADVNGDGKPDMLIGTNSLNGFLVESGNGDGTYQAPQTVVGNGAATNIVVADVNGDGKLDVIVANGSNAGVFLGNGDGTFQGEVDYDNGVGSVSLGDFNGDGKPDLVVITYGSVDLLLGNGDGTFQDPVTIVPGNSIESLAVGDFNGDGKLDVATAPAASGAYTISISLGNGNGTFQNPKVSASVNAYPSRLVAADLNLDGKLDLVSFDEYGYIGVFLGNGDGTLQTEQTLVRGSFGQMAVADINGDGKPDLIVPNYYSANTVSVFPGNGDGTFGNAVSYATGKYPIWVAVADINHDGKPDFAVVNYQDFTASVFLNQVTQTAKLTGVTLPGVSADAVSGAYAGDANYAAAATNTLTLASNPPGAGTTTLAVSPASGALGTEFTLTATVATGAGAKITQGSVNFYVNGVLLANVEIDSTTGVATIATRSLPAGTNSITAIFTGTASNKTSSSKAVAVAVTGKYLTTTALASTGIQGSYALSALVDAFGQGSPTGSVVFTDSSTTPATALGTVPLTEAGLTSMFAPASAPTLAAGSDPVWTVAGDFNGDGKQDLAVANQADGTIGIFLGNGDGTFGAQTTTTVLSTPNEFVAGDFNGDGKLDLAVTDFGAKTVTVLLGNGDGTFQTAPAITAGSGPVAVAAGDMNGDGKLDLVVLNYTDSTLNVLLGNGDGTFKVQTAVSAGSSPQGLAVGDFNSDGKLDVVVANGGGNAVDVLLGNGDGTLGAVTAFSSPQDPVNVVVKDVNLDGKLDLVVSEFGNGNISVLFGNGDGTFQAAQSYAVGANPFQAAVADVNGDGNPDLIVSNYGSSSVSVLLGNGSAGTFQPQQTYAVGPNPYSVAAADFNDDGRIDIATPNFSGRSVSVLLGSVTEGVTLTGVTLPGSGSDNVTATYSGDTNFGASTSNTLTLPSHPVGTTTTLAATPATAALGAVVALTATVADVNGKAVTSGGVSFYNGKTLLSTVQLVAVTSGSSKAGTATFSTRALPPGTDSLTAQFNGTSTDATSTSAAQTVTVSGQYPTTTTLSSTGSKGNYTLTAGVQAHAPLTPTGNVNFVDTTSNTTLGSVALSASTSGFSFVPGATPATGTNPYFVTMADVNNDSKLDIVVGNYYGAKVTVLLGNGDGTYQAANSFGGNNAGGIRSVAVGDFNNDGKQDVVTANGVPSIGVFLGNGDGTFGAETEYSPNGYTYSVAVGDFNHDGKLDIVAANNGGTVSVFLGNGDGTFQAQQAYSAVNSEYPEVVVGDFNGDGKLDLAVVGDNQPSVGILLGNGDGTFQVQQSFATNGYPNSIAFADINGDGKLDAVVTSDNENTLSVMIGNGDGTLQSGVVIATGTTPTSVQIGDLNGDGKLDLAVSNSGSGTVGIYLGNGDGTFQTPTTISAPTPQTVALGDVNNDGRLDIAAVDYVSGNTAQVFLNQLGLTATLTGVNVPGSGTHNVVATYAGDTSFTGSTSPSIELAATFATSTIALAAQPSATVAYASPLSVLVTVTGQTGTNVPAGNVTYAIDGGATQTAALTAGTTSATATLNLAGLAVGSHSLAVNYAGDLVHGPASQQTLALTVKQAPQTITFSNPGNTTYGNGGFYVYPSSTSGLAVTVKVVSGPAAVSGNLVSITGAGTVVLEADQAGNTNYAAATPVQQSFTVAKAALSVTVNSPSKVYGTANPTFTSTINGLVGSDTVTVTYSTTATTTSGVGTYPITATLSGAALANYTYTITAGTLTITKQPLTVTVNSASRAYGAANPAFTGTITGLQGTDTATATYSTAATATSPVVSGGYPITATVTGSNLANYNVTVVPGTLTVTPANLTITVGSAAKVYGTANPAFTSTLNGVLNGDTVPVTYSTSATNTSGAGSYPISASTTDANYTATVVAGTLTITPATLTIAVNSFTKVYGSVNPTFTGTVSGLLFNDTVTTTYETTAVQYTYVGSYAITASISGGQSANYTAQVTNGALTITQALLKIVANNGTKVYGTANPAFTGTVTGILNNDAVVVTYSSPATVKTAVGAYANIGATISGIPAVNYSPQVTDGTLTITPAPLTAAVNPSTRVYGAANPTFTDTFTGLVNGDTLTSTYATTATAASPVGSYPVTLTLSGTLLPNYTPTITNSTLTVTQAQLTVTATSTSSVYGSAVPALAYTVTGFVNGDTVAAVSGAASETTTAVKTSAAGTYPIAVAQGTLAATNYSFVFVNGTLTVNKAPLTVAVNSASRTYGAANPVLTGTITGQQNGDAITAAYSTTATAASGIGTYPITPTLAGANLADYTASITSGTLTVNQAQLTVVVNNASRAYGSANPVFTGTITGQQNGDVITATYSTTATAASAAGTYPITPTLAGANLADYAPAITNGTLTVNPVPLVSLPAAPVTFSSTSVGSASAPMTITLSNTGDAALTGITLSVAGTNATSFTLPPSANLCGSALAAGSSCSFGIVFQPAAAGALSAAVVIADNATGSPQSLAVSGTGLPGAPTVAFDGIGSSGIFLDLGLAVSSSATASPAGLGATCLWTTKTSGVVVATDNSANGGGSTDTGGAWVSWTPVNGSCSTVNGTTTIYSYLQTDSVVGTRCLFNGCTIKFGGSGSASAGLIGGSSEVPLAPGVATALNGSSGSGLAVTAAATELRPEDAEFATARALTACGTPVAAGSQYLGLGYTNRQTIGSYYSSSKFTVVNFSLPPSYSVTSIGVAPVLVVVNGDGTSNGFGDPGLTNITTGVLGLFLDGTFNQTQDALITPEVGSSEPVTTLIREPLSGAYNVMEYNVPNSQPLKTSQDAGLRQLAAGVNCSGNAPKSNPMNLPAGPGFRRRAIGTSEELSESITRVNSLAYGLWSVGNFKGYTRAAAPNAKYLTVDGVDPIQTSYTGGAIPTTAAQIQNVTLANSLSGSYPIFSTIRLVNLGASPSAAVTSLASAAQNFAPKSGRPDFVPFGQLAINRSHFVPPAGAGQPATASNGSGKACGSVESGGDVGGLVITKAGDFDYCYNYGSHTGVTGDRR